MGYLNPVLSYGTERFCADAAAAGVDGLIMVDLPTEEADMLVPHATAHGIDIIRLVAPTTDDERLPLVLDGSSGFVYYVSITGITGTRSATAEHLAEAIPRIRRVTDLPIAVGFGVRSPAQAAEACAWLMRRWWVRRCAARSRRIWVPRLVRSVLDQVRELAEGVRGARR